MICMNCDGRIGPGIVNDGSVCTCSPPEPAKGIDGDRFADVADDATMEVAIKRCRFGWMVTACGDWFPGPPKSWRPTRASAEARARRYFTRRARTLRWQAKRRARREVAYSYVVGVDDEGRMVPRG